MNQTSVIHVGIADDNEQFRETLRDILQYETDMQIVGMWRHGADVLLGLEEVQPDVVLLDINMPFLNGVEAMKRIHERYPDVRVIMLTMHDDDGYVLETLKSGASGYLVKDGSASDIIRAIREVAAGRAMVHPQVTHTVISQFQNYAQLNDSWKEILTEREMDVLREIANGKSNEQIANTLHITQKTVKNHISSIFQKLEVSDRTQAVVIALKRHWLSA
ncbi:response regulator [Alicyclobacillus mengziensis]|uniref:response regulator n=1 Tax=Alicyclobacillus mengziensis TaxID=2931921 RepID=UPI002012AB1D|nr:response regulator transcription factor [Alicyclobacillus mengziensis]